MWNNSGKTAPDREWKETTWWHGNIRACSPTSIARWATWAIAGIAVLVSVGWLFQVTLFKSVMATWQPMSIITAVCFLLVAIELSWLQGDPASVRRRPLLQTPALIVGLVALLTIALYAVRWITGQPPPVGQVPLLKLFWLPVTRLALLTAILFIGTGCALALLARGGRRAINVAHFLMVAVGMAGYVVIIGYLLGVESLHRLLDISMSIYTGLAFCIASCAMLHLRPDSRVMAVFTSDRSGGIMARQLMPAILLIPLMIGWIRIYSERSGMIESEVGVVLVALAYATIMSGLLWLAAWSVNRSDEARVHAQGEREQLLVEVQHRALELDSVFGALPFLVSLHGCDGTWLRTNPAVVKLFGFDPTTAMREEVARRVQARLPDGTPLTAANMPSSRALLGEEVFGKEYVITDAQGGERVLQVNAMPLKVGNDVYGMVLAQQDITERKRIEKELADSRSELSAMLENVPLVMLLLDRERKVRKVNAAAVEFAGRSQAEMIGLRAGEALRCLHAMDTAEGCGVGPACENCAVRRAVAETYDSGINQQGVEATISFGHRGQLEELTFLVTASLLTIFAEELCLVCIENITERKQVEKLRRNAHAELERMVADRTTELLKMNNALTTEIAERQRAEELLHFQALELEQEVVRRQMALESLQEQALQLEKEIEERRTAQDEMVKLNENLEQRVQERTAELAANYAELRRMNKLFVGRELRMVELKERIRALEKHGEGLNHES